MKTRKTIRQHNTGNHRHNRQGITLLFVVSMIVLFLLMGTTFMIIANDYRRASKPRLLKNLNEVDSQALVQRAFFELIRGPELESVVSPLRTNDLLADMYGYGFKAVVVAGSAADANIPGTTNAATGHFIELELMDPIPGSGVINEVQNLLTGGLVDLNRHSGRFNGQVISFVTGAAKGISTRILDYQVDDQGDADPLNDDIKFVIELPSRIDRGSFSLAELNGAEIIINGKAFGGVGVGDFDQSATSTMAALGAEALLPNRVGESLDELIGRSFAPDENGVEQPVFGPGYLSFLSVDEDGKVMHNRLANLLGPNESYDGPDYQNMYLSGFDSMGNLIPSFQRPSLAAFHSSAPPAVGGPTFKFSVFDQRRTDLFPDLTDTFELEVDTDNDGVLDAFWMDIGLPIQTTPEGLRYRPLVAYRVIDQDGLVNLNLAGNLSDQRHSVAGVVIQGQGYGPAELAVSSGNNPILTAAQYTNLLEGNDTLGLSGRYGLGIDGAPLTGDEVPGGADRDEWSLRKLFGYPLPETTGNIGQMDGKVGGFFWGSAHNINGRFLINRASERVDANGNPIVLPHEDLNDPDFNNSLPGLDFAGFVLEDDTLTNSPYEANFAPGNLGGWESDDDDQLFGPLELEALLRPTDPDSKLLPGRLVDLLELDTDLRRSVTTESYEVPVAPLAVLDDDGRRVRLNTLIRDRLLEGGVAPGDADGEVEDLVREYLSPEILSGLKMNVNRVFGNGVDDDGNGVVDDPVSRDVNGKILSGEADQENVDQEDSPPMDLNNDHVIDVEDELARYQFAKQLYILMLLTTEDSQLSFASLNEYRTAVAQWCINVVDFRDPDSIHTPFEFDLNPWNGWSVDGVITPGETDPERAVVWGAERPELLLTESFASHDRRTQDLGTNGMVDLGMPADPNADEDFDSSFIPQSSVFLELYNPWTMDANNQVGPAELGDGTGVNLQQLAPDDMPVWRVGFKRPSDVAADPEAPFLRTVVFTNDDPNFTDGGTETFFTSVNTNVPIVQPGGYAVIGSAGNVPEANGEYRTTFGRLVGSTDGDLMLDQTRSITLAPSSDRTDSQIFRNEWDATLDTPAMVETGYQGIAVVIDMPRSLSVSDPTNGYDGMNNTSLTNNGDGHQLVAVQNEPLDATGREPEDAAAIWRNATTNNFRIVELQRLANPLAPWDAEANPYLTIDVISLDLTSYNGLTNDSINNLTDQNERSAAAGGVANGDTDFGSLERGEMEAMMSAPFGRESTGGTDGSGTEEPGGEHRFGFAFEETLGRVNTDFFNMPNLRWLTWNNRPYVSHLELTNVPISSPENLTADFSNRIETEDPYTSQVVDGGGTPLQSKFRHLLNFYGDQDASPMLGNFYRVLDFLEVPSRYVGTERWLNPTQFANNPFNFVSFYRYPGKINLNTIPNEQVYDALMGADVASLSFDDFNASRWRGGASDFFRPYRNSNEGNLVSSADATLVEPGVQCGLFRNDGSSPAVPLFETDSQDGYFQNAMRQRLGNLVTTRSSVFAIWITVGYFEVDENDENDGLRLDPNTGRGVEVGRESGGAVRNRGFYLFDRSIPVAYEPGKNHNIERAILVESFIE